MEGSGHRSSDGCLARKRLLVSLISILVWGPGARADDLSLPAVGSRTNEEIASYKKLSLEELMNLDVTSVSRQPEPYREAPAAIQVVTGQEIRRFGASSIPEALRLADNLDVAQVSSSQWDISARGFNSSVSDKLLVLMDGRSVYTPLLAGVI